MDVKKSNSYSEWTLFRAVKDVLLYFIPRFFVVDTKCFSAQTMIPNNKLYNICENMVNYEMDPKEETSGSQKFAFLPNGLTGVTSIGSQNSTTFVPNLDKYNILKTNTEFDLYDKVVKMEDTFDFRKPKMNLVVQLSYEMQIRTEKNIPEIKSGDGTPAASSDKRHVECDKDPASSLEVSEVNEDKKVCDKKVIKRNRRLKSRSCVKREKKRTRSNSRRSRKANKMTRSRNSSETVVFEDDSAVFENEKPVEVENSVKEDKNVKIEEKVAEVQFGGVVEWSFVSEEDDDISFDDNCNSVAYIIDSSDSLSFCLDDDDWDCVDNATNDNDDMWESFQQCGLFVGSFMCGGSTSAFTASEETEEEISARIRISEANTRWENGLKTFKLLEPCGQKKKLQVHFSSNLVQVHSLISTFDCEDDRKGPWEEFARDRERFSKRIEDLSKIISPVLNEEHRARIYKERHLNEN